MTSPSCHVESPRRHTLLLACQLVRFKIIMGSIPYTPNPKRDKERLLIVEVVFSLLACQVVRYKKIKINSKHTLRTL